MKKILSFRELKKDLNFDLYFNFNFSYEDLQKLNRDFKFSGVDCGHIKVMSLSI